MKRKLLDSLENKTTESTEYTEQQRNYEWNVTAQRLQNEVAQE